MVINFTNLTIETVTNTCFTKQQCIDYAVRMHSTANYEFGILLFIAYMLDNTRQFAWKLNIEAWQKQALAEGMRYAAFMLYTIGLLWWLMLWSGKI